MGMRPDVGSAMTPWHRPGRCKSGRWPPRRFDQERRRLWQDSGLTEADSHDDGAWRPVATDLQPRQGTSMTDSSAVHAAVTPSYQGSCFCGDVHVVVTGAPVAMGYCHCESCRQWSAAPVNAFTLWAPDAVEVTKGASLIGSFAGTPRSHRKWCRTCGGHLFTEHPGMGLVDVYSGVIPDFDFQPACT